MEGFAKIVHGQKPLTIYSKCSFLDIWLGSECASDIPVLVRFYSSAKLKIRIKSEFFGSCRQDVTFSVLIFLSLFSVYVFTTLAWHCCLINRFFQKKTLVKFTTVCCLCEGFTHVLKTHFLYQLRKQKNQLKFDL